MEAESRTGDREEGRTDWRSGGKQFRLYLVHLASSPCSIIY